LAVGITISAANEVVNLVFGVWMEDAFGLKIAALGAASAVIGLSELSGESLVGVLVDRLGKPRAVGAGILLNCAAALALPLFGRTVPGALVGLFLFYLTFEFALVSAIPLMTEILPPARATLMALNVAGHSTGRALGSLLAPLVYTYGIFASAGTALLFNLLGLFALYMLVQGIRDRGEGEVI
jgi:predicted MFS family arabinose efflux permease